MNTFIELTTMSHKPNFLSEVVHECCSPTKYRLDAKGFPDMNVNDETMDMLVKDIMRTALYRSSNASSDGAYVKLMQTSTSTEIVETFNHIEKLIMVELFESPIFFDDSYGTKELI
jgi:hypothetical protein